jgi:hypothetical protein
MAAANGFTVTNGAASVGLDSQPHQRSSNGIKAPALAPFLPAEVVGKILTLTGEEASFIARCAVLGRSWRDAVEYLDHLGKETAMCIIAGCRLGHHCWLCIVSSLLEKRYCR